MWEVDRASERGGLLPRDSSLFRPPGNLFGGDLLVEDQKAYIDLLVVSQEVSQVEADDAQR